MEAKAEGETGHTQHGCFLAMQEVSCHAALQEVSRGGQHPGTTCTLHDTSHNGTTCMLRDRSSKQWDA